MSKGKAYANKKKYNERPVGDFYSTPKSLIWSASDIIGENFGVYNTILEPCDGEGAISTELRKMGFNVITNDLYKGGCDYLTNEWDELPIITNPPFSNWDNFIKKMKSHSPKFLVIGRLNYFGTNSRYQDNIWDGLGKVWCFTRYVDYQTPYREDGMFHVGAMATGWFLWDGSNDKTLNFLDVQKWAKLGFYKKQEI